VSAVTRTVASYPSCDTTSPLPTIVDRRIPRNFQVRRSSAPGSLAEIGVWRGRSPDDPTQRMWASNQPFRVLNANWRCANRSPNASAPYFGAPFCSPREVRKPDRRWIDSQFNPNWPPPLGTLQRGGPHLPTSVHSPLPATGSDSNGMRFPATGGSARWGFDNRFTVCTPPSSLCSQAAKPERADCRVSPGISADAPELLHLIPLLPIPVYRK